MYSIGLDFGTESVRSVLLDIEAGIVIADSVSLYPSGTNGVILDAKNPHLARQNPADYHECLVKVVRDVVKKAGTKNRKFNPSKIIGIGIDTTGSTPLPVDEKMVPLCFHAEFKGNKNAMAYLWKDHVSADEAEEITQTARSKRPEYLAKIGGVYSSEWFFSKLLYIARHHKSVFNATASFMEICDYIPAVLSGKTNPKETLRSICAAGHKAMYSEEWDGLPDEEFLSCVDRSFRDIRKKLYTKAYPAGIQAGFLSQEWARKLGIPKGIPISVGALDAHMGAVGAGVRPGLLVKVIGTSTCDMTVITNRKAGPIPGICGIVPDSIIPGYAGIEAGQSAVGDIFNWFVKNFGTSGSTEKSHRSFMTASSKLRPGESGLLALDWNNGNRSILVDQKLTGLIVGFTLNTRPEEVYRTLIEATGFGARTIIERLREYGIKIQEIVATGGIPDKNPLLMQIYADITASTIKIADCPQTCALGAAIFGAIAAGKQAGGYTDVSEAQQKTCRFKQKRYNPDRNNTKTYDRIYHLYREVHDAFGLKTNEHNLYPVMKELLNIRKELV